MKKTNIQSIKKEANLIGFSIVDWQLYKAAQEINSFFGLNSETLIFALLKKGIKPIVTSFFRISQETIREKVKKAIDQKIIPPIDIESHMYMLRHQIFSYLIREYGSLFKDIDDSYIKDLFENEKNNEYKIKIYRQVALYSLDEKELDDAFFEIFDKNKREKIKDFFIYRDICAGRNSFINLFVQNNELLSIDNLLILRRKDIREKIDQLTIKNKDTFEDHIVRQIEKKYPTRSLLLQLNNYSSKLNISINGFTQFAGLLKKFLSTKIKETIEIDGKKESITRGFNIQKDIIRDYVEKLDKNGQSLSNVIGATLTEEEFIRLFTIIQRVFFLTKNNRFEVIVALIQKGYNSAYDIMKIGRKKFLNSMEAETLSKTEKEYAYNAAETKINKVLAVLNKHSQSATPLTPQAVKATNVGVSDEEPQSKISILRMPELKELFGRQDVVDVDHADSVFGPAAYLVDLLNLLKQIEVKTGNLYEKLIERRPDIAKIPLNCKNALTLVPYIDLVIELLEYHIAVNDDITTEISEAWNTTKEQDALKIEPEHCIYGVYDKIKAHYTWTQAPFDLKNEEIRLYTQAMNIDRAYWTKLVGDENSINPDYEILGLHEEDKACFDNSVSYRQEILKGLVFENINGQSRLYIRNFLDTTGLTLPQLEELLGSHIVNPYNENAEEEKYRHTIHYKDRLELKNAYLEFLNEDAANDFVFRMHQYKRLQQATSWDISLLDAILYPFVGNDSTDIANIALVKKMQKQYNLSNQQLELLFGNISVLDYKNTRSCVNKLFIDNNFPQQYKDRFTSIVNEESIELENREVYQVDGALSPFANYIFSVLGFDTENTELLKFLISKKQDELSLDKEAITDLTRLSLFVSHLGVSIEAFKVYWERKGIESTSFNNQLLSEAFEDFSLFERHNISLIELNNLLTINKDENYKKALEETTKKIINIIIENENAEQSESDEIIKDKLIIELQFFEALTKDKIIILADELVQKSFVTYLEESIDDSNSEEKESEIIDDFIRPLTQAMQFVSILNLNEEQLKDYLNNISSQSINAFDLSSFNLIHLIQLLYLFETTPYLNNNNKIWELYATILSSEGDVFEKLKLKSSVVLPADTLNQIKWIIELGKLYDLEIDPVEAIRWIKKDPTKGEINGEIINEGKANEERIKGIKKITKQVLGNQTHTERVTLLRDRLREKQRDALVSYYLNLSKEDDLIDSADIFSYLLIDSQMTPAVSTSRIVQATLAIQLFIQRIQFNLEKDIVMDSDDKKRWVWMSLYRVWEANRKIFIYPENWLEPELRDDKSPFFNDLEKELNSNEITTESIEQSYNNYLSKVEKIANIEYCQMFNEKLGDNYSILHVVGRSHEVPHKYYYRKFVNESYWTPWEALDLDINSEHVAPVVINERLLLFWLEYEEAAEDPNISNLKVDSDDFNFEAEPPKKLLNVQICWSEFKNKKWTAKKISKDRIAIPEVEKGKLVEKHNIRLVFREDSQELLVIFYYNTETLYRTEKREAFNPPVLTQNSNNENHYNLPNYEYNSGYLSSNENQVGSENHNDFIPHETGLGEHDYNPRYIYDIEPDPNPEPIETIKIEIGEVSYVHAFRCKIKAYNNLILETEANWSKIDNYVIPEDVDNYYQKFKDHDGVISLPVDTNNKVVLKLNQGSALITYPHQYSNFTCQSPFIVEQGEHSLICIPNKLPRIINDNFVRYEMAINKIEFENTQHSYHKKFAIRRNIFTDKDSSLELENGVAYQKAEMIPTYDISRVLRPVSVLYSTNIDTYLGYHPFVDIIRKQNERQGLTGLLDPGKDSYIFKRHDSVEELLPRQANTKIVDYVDFAKSCVSNNALEENFDFNTDGALGLYNWEMFYHIPFMIANHFYTEGNYDEALKWIHYIFDPREVRDSDSSEDKNLTHFWKFKPFADHNTTQDIDDLMFDTLGKASGKEDKHGNKNSIDKQIEAWARDPFKPHNVARMRIDAYMKATVMRYIDIIIARGDQSFRVDTMESINEALQYYIIAAQILGKKPEVIKTSILSPKSFESFGSGDFSNALESFEEAIIKPENEVKLEKSIEAQEIEISTTPASEDKYKKNMVQSLYTNLHKTEEVYKLYFEIPKNDKLFRYWELVGDRLFKIRNSLNLDGIKRNLSLFAPPIDPGMLASAAAAGLDIKALVNGQDGPATQYRFNVVMGQALQLCAELKSLGSQLSIAYEKEDSEKMVDMRSKHEIILSEMVTRIKEQAIEDSKIQLEQLDKQKEIIDFRKEFYETRKSRMKKEQKQLDYMDNAVGLRTASQATMTIAGVMGMLPETNSGGAGFGGTPTFTIQFGGKKLAFGPQVLSTTLNMLASIQDHKASKSGILAGYERRQEEWNFQSDMAEKEYAPLEKQVLSAQIRKSMAEYELENHKKQIEHSKEAYDVLQTKYSNKELYSWMKKEIAQLHRYVYNMTYSLAKQAQKAYDFELNPGGFSQFISAGHFDSKYEGLLAGEKLYQELKEMELAYQKNNKRKYELTKHISLAMLNPVQLLELQKEGTCEIQIPELLFDMDHPGHCNRRIKSVSLTIPCVTGPYTSVSADLSLTSNTFRTKEGKTIDGQPLVASIATSSAVNDNGMFQLNFNDERYLPFEGAGVNSVWSLSLPIAIKQFDYNTISDVILSIQYTAENGGNRLVVEKKLISNITTYLKANEEKFALFIDVKAQYPDVFEKLKTEDTAIQLSRKLLPGFLVDRETVNINKILRYDDETETVIKGEFLFGTSIGMSKFAEDNIPKKMMLVVQLNL
ncbi:MAG: neuraminidase-like domain-containing protein [Bacteroidales bacterium]|nr:neuraminidase-like domain-containing protein [Bacteroidales bacterium]